MNYRNSRYRVELAGPEHDPGLNELLNQSDFPGPIQVSFQRSPSVIQSYAKESERSQIYVLIYQPQDQVVGMGVVSLRTIWWQGQPKRLAYLSGLRIDPAHQRAFLQLPQMYEAMYQSTKDQVDLYWTTIVSSNQAVIRMFEKERKYMPRYQFRGEIETFFIGPKAQRSLAISPTRLEAFGERAWDNGAIYDLSELERLGATFYQVDNQLGYLIEPHWKQYRIQAYHGWYRVMPYMPGRLLHWPVFPKAGQTARYLAAGIYGPGDPLPMLQTLRDQAMTYDFIMLSALQGSALAKACHRLTPAVYRSRLYQVIFHDQPRYDLSDWTVDVLFL